MAAGTKQDPWVLKTPPGTSGYTMYKDEGSDPPALVCQVGSTTLKYHLRAIEDLHGWLRGQDGWVPLGAADEALRLLPHFVLANPLNTWTSKGRDMPEAPPETFHGWWREHRGRTRDSP